jgi:hypothetical protein
MTTKKQAKLIVTRGESVPRTPGKCNLGTNASGPTRPGCHSVEVGVGVNLLHSVGSASYTAFRLLVCKHRPHLCLSASNGGWQDHLNPHQVLVEIPLEEAPLELLY